MYVFISESCRKESKIFGQESKIDKIARQIERLDYHQFTTHVDKFEHPFYVKKQVAYHYRLLIKLVDFEIDGKHHQVAVFFKIFNRSNKGYDDFYYHVEKQGNILYNQQNIDKKLDKYLQLILQKKDITNTKVMNKTDSDGYFFQIKNDILHLSSLLTTPKQYYEENVHWIYGVRPYLPDGDFSAVFDVIQTAIEQGKSQQINIAGHDIFFQDNLKLTACNQSLDNFSRILPQGCVFDKSHWQQIQSLELPVYLNQFQQTVINELFKQNTSFPYIINAPNNHGKTSLFAILSLHFLSQPNWQNHGVLPCLLLCSTKQKEQIKQQLTQYVKYYKKYINTSLDVSYDELEMLINECCHDLVSYIQSHADDECLSRFALDKMIDFDKFTDLWQSSSLYNKNPFKQYPVSLIWHVIYDVIKGKKIMSETEFAADAVNSNINSSIGNDHIGGDKISHDDFMMIYQNVYKGWYESLQKEKGYWDLQDLVAHANRNPKNPNYAALMIDDAEQYTDLDIEFLIKQCYWYQKDGLINQAPLLFFGNHQTKSSYADEWHTSLTALLHQLLDEFNDKVILQPTVLDYQADFVSILQYLLQHKRQALQLSQKLISDNLNVKIHHQEIYFIDVKNKELLHALFGNKSVPIIINQSRQNAESYLTNDKQIGQIFTYTTPSEGDINFLAFDELNQKYQHIALAGFFDEELSCFLSDDLMSSLDLMQKYHVDEVLSRIHQAVNQSLSHVFIIGQKSEYDVWECIFSHKNNCFIREANIGDINRHFDYYQNYKQFSEYTKEELMARAEWLFHHAYYDYCMQALIRVAHINKNYEYYFEFSHGEGQKIFTLSYLWKLKNCDALLSYVRYFKDSLPKGYMGNCYLIDLLGEQLLTLSKTDVFNTIFNKYLTQHKEGDWAELWQILLDELMERLPNLALIDKEYRNLCHQLERAVTKKTTHIYHYLAQCHYHMGDKNKAFSYWNTSSVYKELEQMPLAYYELLLTHTKDWHEKLLCQIYLKDLGAIMNTVTTHDMNELQLSYWDKMLPHLNDIQELKPVLAYLLPDIYRPEILQRIYDYCKDEEDISGEFEHRLQRLLTVHACLCGDWQYVIERIEYYKPADEVSIVDRLSKNLSFNIQTKHNKKNKKTMGEIQSSVIKLKLDDPQPELVDILYALNLNETMMAIANKPYYEDEIDENIGRIFTAIAQIFSKQIVDDHIWHVDFPAVRALALLLEKGANHQDRHDFYQSFLATKHHHHGFALARFALFYDDIKSLVYDRADDETFKEHLNNVEVLYQKYKDNIDALSPTDKKRNIEPLKNREEIIKSVLALTDKEHKEIQRLKNLEQEYIKEQARLEKERQKQEQLEQERLEKERQEQERLAKEKLEQERLAKEKQEAEKARLAQEKLEQERLEQERLAQERLEQEKLERERQEQERQEQEQLARLQQEQAEKQRQEQPTQAQSAQMQLAQKEPQEPTQRKTKPEQTAQEQVQAHEITNQAPACQESRPYERKTAQAVSSFEFFGWRVFVARLYGRVNVEDLATGERFSVQLHDMTVQSDWYYEEENGCYHLVQTPLTIEIAGNMVFINHLIHGVSLTIRV